MIAAWPCPARKGVRHGGAFVESACIDEIVAYIAPSYRAGAKPLLGECCGNRDIANALS